MNRSRRLCLSLAVVVVTFSPLLAPAQDTRTVIEPRIPPSCVVLYAEKTGHAEVLPEEFEVTTDTMRIQRALDGCTPGHAVELGLAAGHNAFLTGSIELREGVTLLIDKGVTLYASRDPKDYDANPGAEGSLLCGTMLQVNAGYDPSTTYDLKKSSLPTGRPCKPLISVNVKNAAIMGDGIIDGRGGAMIKGHDYTWWQMARAAEPKQLVYYSELMIVANHADGFVLYRITLHNAANYHVYIGETDGFTAWGTHLQSPTIKSVDARNTDGFDPRSSTNITIAHSWIDNRDDNISIKTGVTHMSAIDNHFYRGHGMSIGSETNTGDSFLLVDGLTEDHTTSGIRVKSNAQRGGPVHDLTYRNVCMRDVTVPIAISPFYNNQTIEGFTDPGIKGDHIPSFENISFRNVFATTPGDVLIAGKDPAHITTVMMDGVAVKGIRPDQVHSQFSHITVIGRGTQLKFAGKGVKVSGAGAGSGDSFGSDLDACAGRFAPMR